MYNTSPITQRTNRTVRTTQNNIHGSKQNLLEKNKYKFRTITHTKIKNKKHKCLQSTKKLLQKINFNNI